MAQSTKQISEEVFMLLKEKQKAVGTLFEKAVGHSAEARIKDLKAHSDAPELDMLIAETKMTMLHYVPDLKAVFNAVFDQDKTSNNIFLSVYNRAEEHFGIQYREMSEETICLDAVVFKKVTWKPADAQEPIKHMLSARDNENKRKRTIEQFLIHFFEKAYNREQSDTAKAEMAS